METTKVDGRQSNSNFLKTITCAKIGRWVEQRRQRRLARALIFIANGSMREWSNERMAKERIVSGSFAIRLFAIFLPIRL